MCGTISGAENTAMNTTGPHRPYILMGTKGLNK